MFHEGHSMTARAHRAAIRAQLGLPPEEGSTFASDWLAYVQAERVRAAETEKSELIRWAKETFENQPPAEHVVRPWEEVVSQWRAFDALTCLTD